MANNITKQPQLRPNNTKTSSKTVTKTKLSTQWKLALMLGVLSLLVYANTLKNGFVYDDLSAITKNTIVSKGLSAIPELLSTPYRWGYWHVPNDTYRPLSLVMFAAEWQFFGKNPLPGHLVNILLYAGCVMMLFFFLTRFLGHNKSAAAFIATLLFALHPVHTEVVANIKSRDELLCFFFAFFSLHELAKYMQTAKIKQLLLGAFCFMLAILAKETVMSFLGVIFLVFIFYMNNDRKRSIHICISVLVVAAICLAIRYAVLDHYHAGQFSEIPVLDNGLVKPGLPFASRIASAFLIMGYYIKLLIVPYPLIMDYSYNHIPLVGFSNPLALASVILYIGLVVFALKLFFKNRKDPFAFCILYFLITMSLYSNLFVLIAATLGERFLFFSSVGFCLLIALLLEKWASKEAGDGLEWLKSPKILAVIIPVALIFALLTIDRNGDWTDNYTLFSTDIKRAPESVKLNYLLGAQLELTDAKEEKDPVKQKKIREEGIGYLSKALSIYPDYDDAQSELCGAYFRDGHDDSAEVHGKISLQLNPANAVTLNNMGGIYFNKKQYARTIEYCEKAISIQPDIVDMYTNVAASFLIMGKSDSGISYLYRAIAVDPAYNTSYQFLATAYKGMGKTDSAQKYENIVKHNSAGL